MSGKIGRPPVDPLIRFEGKVAVASNGCWIWTAAKDSDGYGRLRVGNAYVYAHRFAYETYREPIPEGAILDHVVCDTPSCVNPYHVEPSTHRDNNLRGRSPAARNARKKLCDHGHKLDGRKRNGDRYCKTCQRGHAAAYRERHGRAA